MAETLTANFGWTKPDPGASANTWGATLNATTDKVDAQVFANQQRGVEIGSGALWFTATPPTNWLICNGASLSTTTYAALFAVIGYTWGGSGANFNLPPLANVFPMGAGTLAAIGGEATHRLTAGEMPVHPHAIVDVAHNHVLDQSPHSHADYGHGHTVNQSPHAHGGGVHDGGARNTGGYPPQAETLGSTDAANANISIATGYANLQPVNANISLEASGTGLSTTQNAGGGAPHNNLPPYLQINFIIKYQ